MFKRNQSIDKNAMLASQAKTIAELTVVKDSAYYERNQLVLFLAKLFPSHLAIHDPKDKTWEYSWRWVVCVHTPAGQMAWHIHEDERFQFEYAGLKLEANDWDGHTTEEKYTDLRNYKWKRYFRARGFVEE